MLPDVPEDDYRQYQADQFSQDTNNKIGQFQFEQAADSQIATLAPPPEPAPPPPPPELPAAVQAAQAQYEPPAPPPPPPPPPPPEPPPEQPPPEQTPAGPTAAPTPPTPAPAPPSTPPTPAPDQSASGDWMGSALGAVEKAGGNVQTFFDNFNQGASDMTASALNAAEKSGANVQDFFSSLPPPPIPQPATPTQAAASPAATLQAGGSDVAGVPGWLADLIAKNAPANLANDPDFIRTVAAGARAESGWDPNKVQNGFAMGSGKGARGLFQFDMGGMGAGMDESSLLGDQGAAYQASKIVPLYAQAYQSAPAGLSGADKASWVASRAERPLGMDDPASAARQNYATAYSQIGGDQPVWQQAGNAVSGAAQGAVQAVQQKASQISQFGDQQLSADEAYAACGPAAAVRFASMFGRNPTLREATDLAASVGWTPGQGMAGLSSEKSLMDKLGVATHMVGANIQQMAQEASTGNPVTISTPGHYFFADNYDPTSGAFHVGQSGLDLKGGAEWMTPDQMQQRMGQIQGALFADNPTVPAPSTADQASNPSGFLDRTKQSVMSSFTSAMSGLGSTGQDILSALGQAPQKAATTVSDLDQAVQDAAQGVTGREAQVIPSSYQDFTSQIQTPTDQDLLSRLPGGQALGTAASALGSGLKLSQNVLNEVSPTTAIARVQAGEESQLWNDPEYRSIMDKAGITPDMPAFDMVNAMGQLSPADRQVLADKVAALRSQGLASESAASFADPQTQEDLTNRWNLLGGLLAGGIAPAGFASGLGRAAVATAIDPASLPFSAVGEVPRILGEGARAIGLGAPELGPAAGLVSGGAQATGDAGTLADRLAALDAGLAPKASISDLAPEAQTLYQRLQSAPMLTAQEAADTLGSPQMPQYLDGVVNFLGDQRQKLLDGALTNRDVAKAWLLTIGSMRSQAREAANVPEDLAVPGAISQIGGRSMVRPEDATAAWLLSPEGKAALNSIETGQPSQTALDALDTFRQGAGFGQPQLATMMKLDPATTFGRIPDVTQAVNDAGRNGDMQAIGDALGQLRGIGPNKTPFIKHLLGMGNGVTVDSNEINWWLTGQPNARALPSDVSEFTGNVGRAGPSTGIPAYLQQQISDRFQQLRDLGYGADIPADAYDHVMHHWLWDTIKGAQTSHDVMYNAMRNALVASEPPASTGAGSLARFAMPAAQGAIGSGYAESQRPGATPQSVLGAALLGGGLSAARSGLGLRGTARLGSLGARLVEDTTGGRPYNAQSLMDAYNAVTPQRVASIQQRVLDTLAPNLVNRNADTAAARDLIQQVWDQGKGMLDNSRVTATGLGDKAAAALADGGGFTNKLNSAGTAADSAAWTRSQVGPSRVSLEQAADFVQREAAADNMALGSTQALDELGGRDPQALNRVYAYTTAGPPLIGPNKPSMWLQWEDGAPRVTSVHHHYGLGSPEADIHIASTPPGLKHMMWDNGVVQGGQRVASPTGDVIRGWQDAGTPIGTDANGILRKIANTDALVGPSGENDMRMATVLAGMPNDVASQIRQGKLTDPEQIASILLREAVPQSNPALLAGKRALGLDANAKLPQSVKDALSLGGQDNGLRTESLMVDPQLQHIKSIYLAGAGDNYLNEGLANTSGRTRLQLAQALRQRIMQETGKDVPIIFKDISPEVRGQQASLPSKLISDARVLEGPADASLAPGRGRIVQGYTGAGYRNIGITPQPGAPLVGRAATGAIQGAAGSGYAESQRPGATPASVARAALIGGGLGAGRALIPGLGRQVPRILRLAEEGNNAYGLTTDSLAEAGRQADADAQRIAQLREGAMAANPFSLRASPPSATSQPLSNEEVLSHLQAIDDIRGQNAQRIDELQNQIEGGYFSNASGDRGGGGVVRPPNMVGWTDQAIINYARREGLNPYQVDWFGGGRGELQGMSQERLLGGARQTLPEARAELADLQQQQQQIEQATNHVWSVGSSGDALYRQEPGAAGVAGGRLPRFDAEGNPVGMAAEDLQRAYQARGSAAGPAELASAPLPAGARDISMTPEEQAARLQLEKFPEDIRQTISDAAQSVNWANTERRGVIPDAVASNLAREYASSHSLDDLIAAHTPGQAYNTEQLRAMKNAIGGQGAKVADLARAIQGGDDSTATLGQWLQEGDKLQRLVQMLEGGRAEMGRGMRAFQAESNLQNLAPGEAIGKIVNSVGRDNLMEAVNNYQNLIDQGADPLKLAKFWNGLTAKPPGWLDWYKALRYNSMISGAPTVERIGLSGALENLYAGLREGGTALATGNPREAAAIGRGALQGFGHGAQNAMQTLVHGINEDQALAGGFPRGIAARVTGPQRAIATALEAPGRLHSALQDLTQGTAYGMRMYQRAAQEADAAGLSGKAANEFIQRFVNDAPLSRTGQMAMRDAHAFAQRAAMRGDMGNFGQALSAIGQAGPIGHIVMPFARVAYNVGARGVERTPLGALGTAIDVARTGGRYLRANTEADVARLGLKGVKPFRERATDNAIGSLLTYAAYQEALQGNVTGAGPQDAAKRDELAAGGWQPYSLRVGGNYIPYRVLGPWAVPLALASSAAEAQTYAKSGEQATDPMSVLGDALRRSGEFAANETYLSDIGDAMRAIQQPDQYGHALLSNFAASHVPYGALLSNVAQATAGPRDVGRGDLGATLASRIPGLAGTLPQRQDILGRPLPRLPGAGWAPESVSPARADPLLSELISHGVSVPLPNKVATARSGAAEVNDLSPDEQNLVQARTGYLANQLVQAQLADPNYQKMGRDEQAAILARIVSASRAQAENEMIGDVQQRDPSRLKAARKVPITVPVPTRQPLAVP